MRVCFGASMDGGVVSGSLGLVSGSFFPSKASTFSALI